MPTQPTETDEGHPMANQDSIPGLAKSLQETSQPDLPLGACERIVEQAAGQGRTTILGWPYAPPPTYAALPPALPGAGETRQLSPHIVETVTKLESEPK